ncbi:MAG TPA: hypothetical protein VFP72_00160 [Kineosporiaceae bacterium]|nr:hypothetical protein [Kineosporiaceae bacterium]
MIGPWGRLCLAAGVTAASALSAAPATAAPLGSVTGIWGHGGDASIDLSGSDAISGAGTASPAAPELRPVTVTVPACGANSPNLAQPADVLCPETAALCSATTDPNDSMFWVYQGPPGVTRPAPGQWRFVGQACLHANGGTDPLRIGLSLNDFRRLPLPAGTARVQPPTLRTLVNVDTNVYVEARPVELTTTLLDQPVRVRATPVRFTWTFGDGGTLRTADPGGPYPRMTTTHVYRQPGTPTLRLVTSYTGEYSVAGGRWLPVDGEAEVASAPVTLTVVQTRAELVDQPLTP